MFFWGKVCFCKAYWSQIWKLPQDTRAFTQLGGSPERQQADRLSYVLDWLKRGEVTRTTNTWSSSTSSTLFPYQIDSAATVLIHIKLFITPWTIVCQAPLSMEFSREEYWSGLPFSAPRDLPDPGIQPTFLVSLALAGRFFYHCATWEAYQIDSLGHQPS